MPPKEKEKSVDKSSASKKKDKDKEASQDKKKKDKSKEEGKEKKSKEEKSPKTPKSQKSEDDNKSKKSAKTAKSHSQANLEQVQGTTFPRALPKRDIFPWKAAPNSRGCYQTPGLSIARWKSPHLELALTYLEFLRKTINSCSSLIQPRSGTIRCLIKNFFFLNHPSHIT